MWKRVVVKRLLQVGYSFFLVTIGVLVASFHLGTMSFEESDTYFVFLFYESILLFALSIVWVMLEKKAFFEKCYDIILLVIFNIFAMFMFFFVFDEKKKKCSFIIWDIIHSIALSSGFLLLLFFPSLGKILLPLKILGVIVLLSVVFVVWGLLRNSQVTFISKILWTLFIITLPSVGAPLCYYFLVGKTDPSTWYGTGANAPSEVQEKKKK